MSTDATRSPDACAVCGKDTSGERGFMRLYVEGRPVQLCCPLCLKTYQENPGHYQIAQQGRDAEQAYHGDTKW